MNLNVIVSGCQFNFSYGYYAPPMVRRVQPEWGPRYGSFPLTVELEDSLDMLSHGQASTDSMPPFPTPSGRLNCGILTDCTGHIAVLDVHCMCRKGACLGTQIGQMQSSKGHTLRLAPLVCRVISP